MANRGGLAVYVTSHGFGHLNRTVAVLNKMPADVPIVIRCHPSLFDRWRERLSHPARFEAHESDSGAINPPGDSAATDGPATIDRARDAFARSMARLEDDVAILRDEGTAAVLCDAPPLPLLAAKRARIPGFLLANFTWSEIYEPHAKKLGHEATQFVSEVRSSYRSAARIFRAEPAMAMKDIAPIENVGLVVNPGHDRRKELREGLNLSKDDKLVYFYVGRYGQEGLGWERLAKMKGVHFLGFHPAAGSPANYHVIPAADWTGADLAASTDAIVAKAGYGTVSEAMASRTPLVYPPRVGFAEHRSLDRSLRLWGGGLPSSSRAFGEMRLEALLKKAFSMTPGPPPFAADGAARVAESLTWRCQVSSGSGRLKCQG